MNKKVQNLLYGILFSGLGIFSYLLLVNYTNLPDSVMESLYTLRAVVFFVMALNILGYFTMWLGGWIHRQYPFYIARRWKITVFYGGVSLLLLALNYGMLVVAKLMVGANHAYTFPNGGIRVLIMVWLVELVILGLLVVNRFMHNTLELQQKAADLQKENTTARFTALQNQLNPHFLFNSLNTLIAEIEYNPRTAVAFTKNLSNVYRYVLQCQEKPLVTLEEELDFARAYLFLHEVRLGDCIRWSAKIPADYYEWNLPPLTLQLLVENVIKHNTITRNKPMEIHIGVESDGWLVVSNRMNPRKKESPCGIGLKNLSKRCELLMNRKIRIEEKNQMFTVKVPLTYE